MLGITFNAAIADAKYYSRCQLAKELYSNGIPKTFLSNCKCTCQPAWALCFE